jgi:hypothetical protein
MVLECQDRLSHLRQIRPSIVDRFDFGLDSRGVINDPLSDVGGRTNLAVNAPVRPAKVMQRPAEMPGMPRTSRSVIFRGGVRRPTS